MNKIPLTKWSNEMIKRYNSGVDNAFVFAGNIGDYAVDTVKIIDYLEIVLKNKLNMDFIGSYDPNMGVTPLYNRDSNGSNSVESFDIMCRNLRSSDRKYAYIINYPNLIVPNTVNGYLSENEKSQLVTLHKTLSSTTFMSSNNILIMLCESTKDINKMLLSSNIKMAVIDIVLPEEKERELFIKSSKRRLEVDDSICKVTDEQLVNLTAGLSLINIEDILLNALDKSALTKDMILDRKKELIRKEHGDIIELFDTSGSSLNNFAGQDHIKDYFKDVVIDAIKDNNLKIIPKGVLLMGPPGTGKTYFSTCLAGDAGINFVEFKMSKILDKWVGEAEKNLEKAFSVFRALAPVGVFIDEMDQALSRGDNDSNSVNKNLFGMFLHELSKPENRGKIIWIGATNYPNKIDEALKRSGRFDKKIPFFAPSKEERAAVFKIHLNKTKFPLGNDISLDELAEKTEGYTQAEIENIVVKALELSMRHKSSTLNKKELDLALEYMLSAQNNRIKEMEDIALVECNDLEFLPEKYRDRRKNLINKKQEM